MNRFYENDDDDFDEEDNFDFNYDNDRNYHYPNYNHNRVAFPRDYESESEGQGNYDIEFHAADLRVPKLIDLAYLTMALTLLSSTITDDYPLDIKTEIESKLIEKLPVPVSIYESILNYTCSIYNKFQLWMIYHKTGKDIWFGRTSINYLYNIFHCIVWYPDGVINLLKTGKNLISSLKIDDSDKYRLMCLYCMKDELEATWPSFVSNNAVDIVAEAPFRNNILNDYWSCHFGNRPFNVLRLENQSIERFMFHHRDVDNWPAKEYFFDRMTLIEQIRSTIRCIDESSPKLQKALLRKLNADQRVYVYTSRALKIISNFADDYEAETNEEDICSTWFAIRNLINREDFVSMFKHLLGSRSLSGALLETIWFSASDDFKNHILINHREVIGCVLHLWAQKNETELFFKIFSNSRMKTKQNITKEPFFIRCSVELIRNQKLPMFDRLLNFCFESPEDRKQFKRDIVQEQGFILYCEQLIIEDMFQLLDQLLNLFLDEEEKLAKFKKDLSRQEFFIKHCEQLITEAEFHRFDRLLNSFVAEIDQPQFRQDLLANSKEIKDYCLRCYVLEERECSSINNLLTSVLPSSPDFIAQYKKNLLTSSEGINHCATILNSQLNLNPIIIDSLPTPDLVSEFKKRLLFSPPAIDKFRELIVRNRLNEMNVSIDRYITSDEDKIALKKQIIGYNSVDLICQVFRENFDETCWQSLLSWWPRDQSTSIDFKSTLPLDEIFDEMLKYCIYSRYDPSHQLRQCILRSDPRFDSLDKFLNWYFESSMKITEYKWQRINAYKEIDAINTLLTRSNYAFLGERDVTYFKTIFNWIFETNSQRIAEFKVEKNGEKISQVIN